MHTPGPWTSTELAAAPYPGFSYGVGHDPLGPSDVAWPIALAVTPDDAHLIAAAPTMLARLENILADCETWQDDPNDTNDPISQIMAECRNAIGIARTGLPDTAATEAGSGHE